jgi:hypothetical protein
MLRARWREPLRQCCVADLSRRPKDRRDAYGPSPRGPYSPAASNWRKRRLRHGQRTVRAALAEGTDPGELEPSTIRSSTCGRGGYTFERLRHASPRPPRLTGGGRRGAPPGPGGRAPSGGANHGEPRRGGSTLLRATGTPLGSPSSPVCSMRRRRYPPPSCAADPSFGNCCSAGRRKAAALAPARRPRDAARAPSQECLPPGRPSPRVTVRTVEDP